MSNESTNAAANPAVTANTNTAPAENSGDNAAVNNNTENKPKEEKRLGAGFAELTRREKAFQAQQKAWKEKIAKYEEYEALMSEVNQNPKSGWRKLLEQGKLSYADITDFILEETKNSKDPEVRVSALEKKLEEAEKARQKERNDAEARELQEQQEHLKKTFDVAKTNIKKLIEAKPDDYELIISSKAYDSVFDVIAETFEQTGQLVDVHVAAQIVNDELKKLYEPIVNLKTFSKTEDQKASRPADSEARKTSATLTTNQVSNTVPAREVQFQPSSREEEVEQIAEALRQMNRK